MAAFLSEGSKFLFFDTSICRNTVWFPSGADSLPRVAEECTLGTTGYSSIAGGIIFFLSLILVCLKAPEKRDLQSQYGTDLEIDENDLESAHKYSYSEGSYVEGGSAHMYEMNGREERDHYGVPQPIGTGRDDRKDTQFTANRYGDAHTNGDYSESLSQCSGHRKRDLSRDYMTDDDLISKRDDDLISKRLKNLDPEEDKYTAKPKDYPDGDEADDRYQPKKPSTVTPPSPSQTVSESRLHTIERMELNTTAGSEDMIEKFVNEVNVSFQVEAEDEKKKKAELTVTTNAFCQPVLCTPDTARSF
jgi:hypothetical protein